MKIICSLHSKQRVVQRVKKIKTEEEAEIYLKDKFSRMMTWTFKWDFVRYGRWNSWNFFMWTGIHRFIYEIIDNWTFKIITYHIKDDKKYKKYMKSEIKRIERLYKH